MTTICSKAKYYKVLIHPIFSQYIQNDKQNDKSNREKEAHIIVYQV